MEKNDYRLYYMINSNCQYETKLGSTHGSWICRQTCLRLAMGQVTIWYSKTCVRQPLSKRPKVGFQDQLSLKVGRKYCRIFQGQHSAILLTFIRQTRFVKILKFKFIKTLTYFLMTEIGFLQSSNKYFSMFLTGV